MASCRSCGAPVKWAETTNGKRMPVDPDPHAEGNVRLEHRDNQPPLARVLSAGGLEEAERSRQHGQAARLFRSHFATCPGAETHRGQGRLA